LSRFPKKGKEEEGGETSGKDQEDNDFLPGIRRFGSVLWVLSHIIKF
jgi:hypothetical protein